MRTEFKYNDGGRSQYFTGEGGDCVTRAIAIASGKDYKEVYDRLAMENKSQRKGMRDGGSGRGKRTALHGINTNRKWFKDYMKELGFEWFPTMQIGQGCKTHLCANELPAGRLVIAVSRHYVAMIDGVIHDTYSPQRIYSSPGSDRCLKGNEFYTKDNQMIHTETRCVYGYWKLKPKI